MRPVSMLLPLLLACTGGDLTLPGDAQPDAIRIVDGDDQRARPGEELDRPLEVQVLDAAERPVEGATVRFSFLEATLGAELEPSTAVTDADGRAQAVARLGLAWGEQTIVARVDQAALEARFTATANGGGGRWNDDDEEDDD